VAVILYCPSCEGIVADGDERCVLCGSDLRVNASLTDSPSVLRDEARLAAERPEAEPSKKLGVLAWFAQLTAGALLAVFCILPALLFVIGVIVVLLGR